MYLALGQNYWQKHEYDADQAVIDLLKTMGFPYEGKMIVYHFPSVEKFEDIEVDPINGSVYYPKDASMTKTELNLSAYARHTKRLEDAFNNLDDCQYELATSLALDDKLQEK